MMVERIITTFNKNVDNEKLSIIWKWCKFNSEASNTVVKELNEDALENMVWNQLVSGFWLIPSLPAVLNLGKALGIYHVFNPSYELDAAIRDKYHPKKTLEANELNDVLPLIEVNLGFKINLPTFVGNWTTADTIYGKLSDRHCYYLWVLKRILELCPDRNTSIIEIGAGMGILGYYLDKEGYKDYTSIDLAYANAAQTYFLYKNLPKRNIILSGEVKNPFDIKYKNSLKLLHTSDFINVPRHRYDIMINMDGVTEMIPEEAQKYVSSDCAPLFLSINHEANDFTVFDICKEIKELKYRYPFWLREGYVEELYSEKR